MPKDTKKSPPQTLDTIAVRGAESGDFWQHSLSLPIAQTSTYTFAKADDLIAYRLGNLEHSEYGRYGNPTVKVVEQKLAQLEGAEAALLFASGMAAEAALFLSLAGKDAHILLTQDHYAGTRALLDILFPKYGVSYSIVPVDNIAAISKAVRKNTVALFTELPTNPHLRVPNLPRLAEVCKKHRLTLIVDATLASPVLCRPLEFGADLVLHSATKYLGGHNDLLAGVLAGSKAMIDVVREHNAVVGAVPSPHDAFLLNRGLKTLHLRMARQSESAAELAARLQKHKKVAAVYYPGLHAADRATCKALLSKGGGGLLSIQPKGGAAAAKAVLDRLQLFLRAASLGGVESMAQITALYVNDPLAPPDAPQLVEPDLIRLSVGVESVHDLWNDLDQALKG